MLVPPGGSLALPPERADTVPLGVDPLDAVPVYPIVKFGPVEAGAAVEVADERPRRIRGEREVPVGAPVPDVSGAVAGDEGGTIGSTEREPVEVVEAVKAALWGGRGI